MDFSDRLKILCDMRHLDTSLHLRFWLHSAHDFHLLTNGAGKNATSHCIFDALYYGFRTFATTWTTTSASSGS